MLVTVSDLQVAVDVMDQDDLADSGYSAKGEI